LIGAVSETPPQRTIDDDPDSLGAEELPEPNRGIFDKREMSDDFFTPEMLNYASVYDNHNQGLRGRRPGGQVGESATPTRPAHTAPQGVENGIVAAPG
jgi:hypothetical protein